MAEGYCSERDPDDGAYERILIKNENGFSENFDILTQAGYLRKNGIYFETGEPANFPVARGGLPAPGSGCGWPYPPPISRMNCKIDLYGPDYYTLDSTAIVGPDSDYCAMAGFTDGRALCPVRPPDSPERVPCETWIVGNAKDTGKPGPDVDHERRPVLHRTGERLPAPPHGPLRPARLQDGHLPGLREHRLAAAPSKSSAELRDEDQGDRPSHAVACPPRALAVLHPRDGFGRAHHGLWRRRARRLRRRRLERHPHSPPDADARGDTRSDPHAARRAQLQPDAPAALRHPRRRDLRQRQAAPNARLATRGDNVDGYCGKAGFGATDKFCFTRQEATRMRRPAITWP